MKPRTWVIFVIVGATCIAFIGVVAFIIWRQQVEVVLGPDAFKLTYQFLLITVVGGAVSAIYKEFQRVAATRAAERSLQLDLLTRAVAAYNAAKKVRRLLRAQAIELGSNPLLHRDPYDKQMQALIDAQLDFEALGECVRASPSLFPGLESDLVAIEEYLGAISGDYETRLKQFTGSPPTLALASAQNVAEFTAKFKKGSAFDTAFKRPFDRLTKTLQALITK